MSKAKKILLNYETNKYCNLIEYWNISINFNLILIKLIAFFLINGKLNRYIYYMLYIHSTTILQQ